MVGKRAKMAAVAKSYTLLVLIFLLSFAKKLVASTSLSQDFRAELEVAIATPRSDASGIVHIPLGKHTLICQLLTQHLFPNLDNGSSSCMAGPNRVCDTFALYTGASVWCTSKHVACSLQQM